MADTDILRAFKRDEPPSIPGSEARYLDEQLKRIEVLLANIITVAKKQEARIVALENP